ncbi:hypothetical protein [Mycolicibacterium fortuitum]|uniref:hypothetical protein n=1 Tax=Mycolicibacterium fortuitum TaxID=1766 RepID=UPI003AAE307E
MATTPLSQRSRFIPAAPSWRRVTVLVSVLLLGWAALVPAGHTPLWWHYLIGVVVIVAFLGSWHGQHVSTTVRRWVPLSRYNRRQRARSAQPRRRRTTADPAPEAAPRSTTLQARIVIHLRPHPHGLTTPADTADQMPWQFVTSWLDRYGVRADELTITSITRTPPTSGLRTDVASLLTTRTPQHRDTWLTYTLRADQNVGALTARQTTMGATDRGASDDVDGPGVPQRAALADTTARRLVAELRERGWLATLVDDEEPLPQFVPPAATVRRETWTATEYSDGFRAVYAIEAGEVESVLKALPALATKALWVSVTVASRGNQPTTVSACVGTLTGTQPGRNPLPGLAGFHGLHREVIPALTVTGLDHALPVAQVNPADLTSLRWPTSAPGIPIGFNRSRQPVYLGLASPEPVRITVTGTREFHVGIVARLALAGLPMAMFTSDPRQWAGLANHGAPQQFSVTPTPLPPGAIVVSDGSSETPSSPITVTLRRPQSSKAPATTIVITQDGKHANLFGITTPHGHQLLSTRLLEAAPRRR